MFEPVSASSSPTELNPNLIFIDSQVDNYSGLASGVNQGQVIMIDSASDGIAQITAALTQHQNISTVQIISHGSEGQLQIGTTNLNLHNLAQYSEQLQQWSQHLDADADIL